MRHSHFAHSMSHNSMIEVYIHNLKQSLAEYSQAVGAVLSRENRKWGQ